MSLLDVQYFVTVEPLKQAAPHGILRYEDYSARGNPSVTTATYRQVSWPAYDGRLYPGQ